MPDVLSAKAMLLLFLFGWIGILLFGAWGKMRDGEAAWGRRTYTISRRDSKSPGGFWLSVGCNVIFAAIFVALAVAILIGYVKVA